jgi:hypothetical protein
MRAKIALSGGVVAGIDIESVIRTSLHAGLATDTSPVIEINDSIGTPVKSASRTNFRAGRIIAVIASHHPKMPRCMREFTLLDVFHPSPKNTPRHLVFLFASDRAGMTPDATVLIDNKTVSHLSTFSLLEHVFEGLQASTS